MLPKSLALKKSRSGLKILNLNKLLPSGKKQKLQKKQKTLDIIQQNFSVLLDAPEINSDLLPAKREPVSVTRDK